VREVVLWAALLASSCALQPAAKELTLPKGVTVRWTPSSPLMADLVQVQAEVPGEAEQPPAIQAGNREEPFPPLPPIQTLRETGLTRYLWSFRITHPGPYTWALHGPVLWTVASVAGNAQELKKVDAQTLWSGKGTP
jgi:hypothetical protein